MRGGTHVRAIGFGFCLVCEAKEPSVRRGWAWGETHFGARDPDGEPMGSTADELETSYLRQAHCSKTQSL